MRAFFLTLLLMLPGLSQATIDAYEFSDEQHEKRFHELTGELRCPKCQNQNIADSDAPLAADLRREVYRMLEQGEPNESIIDFMVTRYGDFVLYRPRVNEVTWLLWYGPFILLGVGVLAVVLISRNRRQQAGSTTGKEADRISQSANRTGEYTPEPGLDPDEAERLKKLLQQDSDK
ncbi:cytochrome c-type biogenesis protein [Marinobacterium sp. MBR-109]|jgi:cytochrome c-type biogenesis protein CcmH|uniref:cytochrome c-type biogenesis protein n=1 Tax=Marinobacterium sp. MBR-109 TaxID=3156462 RepID=UPI00339848C9